LAPCPRSTQEARPDVAGALAILLVMWSVVMADVPPTRADTEPASLNPSGVSGRGLPDLRQGVTRSAEVVLVALYEDAARSINRAAAKATRDLGVKRSAEFRSARAAALRAQIDEAIRRVGLRSRAVVEPIARESYVVGLCQAVTQMREIGVADAVRLTGSRGAVAFTAVDTRAVEVIARDTVGRLNRALASHGEQAQTTLISLNAALTDSEPEVNRAIARGIITGDPRQADRLLRREIGGRLGANTADSVRRLGAAQIRVGQWTGRLRDYVDIVARTRTREATIEARHTRLLENDLSLVQITGRVSVNFCTRYIGLVVSLTGARDGYPGIDELPSSGPPFHPRCSKGTALFDPDLSSSGRAAAHSRALPAFRRAQSAGLLTTDLA